MKAIDMFVDAEGVLRARHTHIAFYLGVAEAEIREAIASARGALERDEPVLDRIENLHGDSVLGHYLTVEQACTVAGILGRPSKAGAEPTPLTNLARSPSRARFVLVV
ncbi:hypothetical protein ASE63_25130 [Bosea sp. Root381]|uniref:hypothetical protein n=1 Tax=Bosea sp. Root381 TaxID=1736524 RepID=UPI0006F99D94|nr:hypothetical protein [Bosea sp. Root381]KRE05049.1 hypothetical protein ASE63_25130 [Bosea sp. Root381]